MSGPSDSACWTQTPGGSGGPNMLVTKPYVSVYRPHACLGILIIERLSDISVAAQVGTDTL